MVPKHIMLVVFVLLLLRWWHTETNFTPLTIRVSRAKCGVDEITRIEHMIDGMITGPIIVFLEINALVRSRVIDEGFLSPIIPVVSAELGITVAHDALSNLVNAMHCGK